MTAWGIVVILAFTSAGATVHASVGPGIGLVAGPALIAVDNGFLPGPGWFRPALLWLALGGGVAVVIRRLM